MDAHNPTPDELDGIDPTVFHRRWLILATLCLSLLLITATVSSVNVAIPTLSRSELRPTATQVLWIVDAYVLVFAALLLPAGALGDRFGRKGALLIGLVIFGVSSASCAYMTTAAALIACRAVMGIGAALIMPSTLSLLQSSFPRRERAKAIAVWAGFAGAGGSLGPLIGGLLVENYWYGSVFFIAAPIALAGFVASAFLAPRSRESERHRLDFGGAALSILGFAALLAAIIEGPERGWSDGLVIVGIVAAVVFLGGFVFYELHRDEPMLDMRFFRDRRFAMGSQGITMTFFTVFGMIFVLVQYLQNVKGYSPLEAGVRGLPFGIAIVLVAPRAPRITAKFGSRRGVAAGMLVIAGGVLLMSFVGVDTPYWWLVACLVMGGIGVGVTMPSLSSGIVQSVPMNKAGVGSAMNDTTREVGSAIGVATLGSIVNTIYRDHAASTIAKLPAALQETARLNVAKALAVINAGEDQLGTGPTEALRHQVRQSFVDGGHAALRVGAGVMVVCAVMIYRRLPDATGHHV